MPCRSRRSLCVVGAASCLLMSRPRIDGLTIQSRPIGLTRAGTAGSGLLALLLLERGHSGHHQGRRIDVVGIELLHSLYEFTRIGACAEEVDELLQVVAGFSDASGLVTTRWCLVASDHRRRVEGRDPVDAGDPLRPVG